jgi:hypothetical protein
MATPSPATPQELLARLDKRAKPEQAAELASVLTAATEAAEAWKNTGPIIIRAVTEQVEANDRGRVVLLQRPVQSVTTLTPVTVGLPVLVTADLDWDIWSGIVGGKMARLDGRYTAVYQAGRGTIGNVEDRFKQAVLEIAAHNWETQRGPRTARFKGEAEESGGGFRVGAGYLIPNRAATYLGGGRVYAL